MRRNWKFLPFLMLACFSLPDTVRSQAAPQSSPEPAGKPKLYVVGYAHLDTQWRWEYPTTIGEYIPNTMRDNFRLLEKYPHYIFNFSGANRYRMMQEYYPSDYQEVKKYVAAGRWFPSGSSVEENDVNSPSAESLIRQILYGTQFFRKEFGKTSAEYMLPDCFGFPASLPSVLAHAGIKGFSTQKLSWGSAMGIPFNIGFWEGPDGRGVIAALNPGEYVGQVREDLSKSAQWIERIQEEGRRSGLYADYHYYGTGDVGGAPKEDSVKLLEAIVTQGLATLPPPRNPDEGSGEAQPPDARLQEVRVGDGPLHVIPASAEQMFLDIGQEQVARLPRYKGDLLLTEHSAGSISSQTYMKRWNRQNEILADAAERASVAAAWLGGKTYPLERLNRAWTLVMGAQFHDILPGTSTPKAYEYSWNDELLALNQFAVVLTSAANAVASVLDTRASGAPVVVYNPLNIDREDVVEALVPFPGSQPQAVRVSGPDGREVPAQLAGFHDGSARVLFLARAPSVGFAVYDVRASEASVAESALSVSKTSLENSRYRIRLDGNGDLASVFDKSVGKELLAAPARLAFQTEKPAHWPAWNMDWADQQKAARGYVQGPARVRILENGPARVALEVERESEGSRFTQRIMLSAGDAGNRIEFGNVIDWKTAEAALKVTFPLTAGNPEATYNWDIGTIRRGNNDPRKYEVPSHQWFDLTDRSGAYGVTVLSDCKYGSDKPDDSTLRLTLLYTPGISEGGRDYGDQSTQDWGHHEFVYGLAGHAGDWRRGQTDWQAYRLNQPLMAFSSPKHPGALGKAFSLLRVNNNRIRVLALKKAEQSDEVVLRLAETGGMEAPDVRIGFAAPLASAREINGQEQPSGPAAMDKGELATRFGPHQVRTFAVRLGEGKVRAASPRSTVVPLPYDRRVASADGTASSEGFDNAGRSLPAEMLPTELDFAGIRFALAPRQAGRPDAVVARGQRIRLPEGPFDRVYLLAASAEGDQTVAFRIGDETVELTVQDWGGYIGQWDNRIWTPAEEPAGAPGAIKYVGLKPGYVKPAPVAWFASHRHIAPGVNEPYAYSYLFAYALPVPPGAGTLTLPDNDKVRILAISVSGGGPQVSPARPLYDMLSREIR